TLTSIFLRQNRGSSDFGFNSHPLTATKLSFEKVVESYNLWEQFKLFAVQDFTVENVLFYERCRKLKFDWITEDGTEPEISSMEMEIQDVYNTFVAPNARFMVNLNGKTRRLIQDSLKRREFSVDIFERALEEVGELMFRNTYPRFLQSRRNTHLKWEEVGSV
ncbi:Regulator of G-protein signaling 20, partial [Basidiobolus ranarum]